VRLRSCAALGADALLHYVEVPLAVAEERIRERNAKPAPDVHHIDLDDFRGFAVESFEPPGADEPPTTLVEPRT
jgi:hypothetical protein